jgi:hypothetical protein
VGEGAPRASATQDGEDAIHYLASGVDRIGRIWRHRWPQGLQQFPLLIGEVGGTGASSEAVEIASQAQLTSLQAAVGDAARQGIVNRVMMNVGDWQLGFDAPRGSGVLPVIYHALYK